jgi:hypothetical protein
MSKRYKDKGRIEGPFVALLKEPMASPAWRTMSPFGRLLFIALKARYNNNLKNNGRLYLSVRTAAKETGLNKNTIARAFHENVHYGFIRMTAPGCLGVWRSWQGTSLAAHRTRLHDRPANQGFYTLGWHHFSGPTKTETRPVQRDRLSRPSRHTTVPSNGTLSRQTVPSDRTYRRTSLSRPTGHI